MKILITGSNGYLGSSLCSHFKKKHDVIPISRENFDLTSQKETINFFNDKYFDVVFHCSIQGGSRLKRDTYKVMDSNLIMYYNLLENRSHFGKLINFGSGAEFFSSSSPYGISKKVISNSISEIEGFYNIRIYSVFDENELETRFIKNSIIKYLNKQEIEIFENKIMDFFYMEDLFLLLDYYIQNNPPKEIDCSYKYSYHLLEIAEFINNMGDYKVPIRILSEKDGIYRGDFLDLGLNFTGVEEGIKRTYDRIKKLV